RTAGNQVHHRFLQRLEPYELRQSGHQRRRSRYGPRQSLRKNLFDRGNTAFDSILLALRLLTGHLPAKKSAPGSPGAFPNAFAASSSPSLCSRNGRQILLFKDSPVVQVVAGDDEGQRAHAYLVVVGHAALVPVALAKSPQQR